MASSFRLYNTLSRTIEGFSPIEEGKIRLYVCGMTVYDEAHIGHARAMLWFDVVVKYLRHRGWSVQFVRNFTDVDDKIIRRAAERNLSPLALAAQYIDAFHRDAAALGLATPDHEPKVSESIDDIIGLISRLVDRSHAYALNGSVLFRVSSCADYGQLSGQKPADLIGSADSEEKESPNDFALWKAAKPGDPSWPSPWGDGRPGWHIECSAMAQRWLGEQIDIHGGGLDLIFPHHENEIAQSQCGCDSAPFSRYWMHNGLLVLGDGRKMGKSEGNSLTIVDLLAQFPAETLRLFYLQSHYRSPLPFDDSTLSNTLSMLARLYEAQDIAQQMGGSEPAQAVADSLGPDAAQVLALGQRFEERFYAAMDEDFNSAKALGYAFEMARAINRFSAHKKAKKRGGSVVAPALAGLKLIPVALGILTHSYADFIQQVREKRLPALGISTAEVDQLLADRAAARADKQWEKADQIRDTLIAKRIVIMDGAQGVTWKIDLRE